MDRIGAGTPRRPESSKERRVYQTPSCAILRLMSGRALGALLLLFLVTPLPALCADCWSGRCGIFAAEEPAAAHQERAAHQEQAAHQGQADATPECHLTQGDGQSAAQTERSFLASMATDCCGLTVEPSQQAVAAPATVLDSSTVSATRHDTGRMQPLRTAAPRHATAAVLSEPQRPLYTLHSTLLI